MGNKLCICSAEDPQQEKSNLDLHLPEDSPCDERGGAHRIVEIKLGWVILPLIKYCSRDQDLWEETKS